MPLDPQRGSRLRRWLHNAFLCPPTRKSLEPSLMALDRQGIWASNQNVIGSTSVKRTRIFLPVTCVTGCKSKQNSRKATTLYCRVLAGCFVLGERGVILDGKIKGKPRKLSKISLGAYIFQRPFLRGLLLEGLIFGGAYLLREIFVYKSIRLASQFEVNLPFFLCFTLYLRAIFEGLLKRAVKFPLLCS